VFELGLVLELHLLSFDFLAPAKKRHKKISQTCLRQKNGDSERLGCHCRKPPCSG
jgi:hypothetical protein